MKIKSYLAFLIISCLAGVYLVEFLQSGQFSSNQKTSDDHHLARLWLKDFERVNADTSQYLISADLVIGSGESYIAAGTQSKGKLIAQEIEQLIRDNLLLPETAQLSNIAAFYQQINVYLKQAASASGIDRQEVLATILYDYDEVALRLSQQLQQLLTSAKYLLHESKIKLDQQRQDFEILQISTRTLLSLFVLLLWYWANQKICEPVTRLTRLADTALKGELFEGITRGPRETLQLSANLTALTDSLSYQANHDALTDLHNRRAFQRILINSVLDANDNGTSSILCFIDLDRFKMVNDSCGHAAGDKLLIQVAQLLKNQLRNSDFVARLGGDEFAILLHDCSTSMGLKICNTIRDAIRDIRYHWGEEVFTISASIGITPFANTRNKAAKKPLEILNTADMACKKAKESGRDNVQIFNADDEVIVKKRDEITWVNRLNTAIEQGRFVLFKQDIVPLGNTPQNGSHFEILIRMMTSNGSLLPPSEFISIAERHQLGSRLDRWVVNAVIDWFLAHPAELDTLNMCSINLSGQSVGNNDIRNFIINKLRSTNFPAEKLCFEITETAAVTDMTNAHLLINELRALGCKFSLDDFGSGLSSFTYLKNLPVDIIKIDGAFVKDMVNDKVNRATVQAITGVAKAVGKLTIAEFVETAEIAEDLQKIGVDFAQGYHFHKPEPLRDQAIMALSSKVPESQEKLSLAHQPA